MLEQETRLFRPIFLGDGMHGKHEMERVDAKAYNVPMKPAAEFFSIEDEVLEHHNHVVDVPRRR